MSGADRSLESLWLKRSREFRKEVTPYFGYMAQSGFPLFVSLIVLSSAFGYIKLIRDLPSDFPITLVGTIALFLILSWSPLRSWLTMPDLVFHMPREAEMKSYLRRAFRRSAMMTSLLGLVVLLLYWPIYRQGDGEAGFGILLLFAAVIRAANLLGAWQERKLAWSSVRLLLRLLRWAANALALAVLLTSEPWQAALFLLLLIALFAVLYRLPDKHTFPWERLIEEESRTRRSYYLFFGLFIDVPTLPSRTASRAYLAWILRYIPNRHRLTYVYLYAGSLVRTEIGGIVLRLVVLFALILYWFAEDGWLSGWGAAAAYIVLLQLVAVQLGGLRHAHRYSVWRHVYPLPDAERASSLLIVDRWAMAAVALLTWLPAAIMLLLQGLVIPAVFALLAAYAQILFVRPGRLRRKLVEDAEEE
ncbi:ABC-2 type transport system permease protein [Paenibacillus catalpae]|uniref:ABC-2 type transport system permease protein n=1 Tax=Paenibacillus catalpae TaxID=1045775 RepID=A0A1I2AVQ9_9BACL|nr:ABC transporter permease [Paenibacillus catalpae]SFE47829.1 ABC-2 type transport system permease protein [Paenibacillus catalpae]